MNYIRLGKRILIKDLIKNIKVKSKFLGSKKTYINRLSSFKKDYSNCLIFVEDLASYDLKKKNCTVILKKKNNNLKSQIITENPRFFFIQVLNFYMSNEINEIHFPKVNILKNKTDYLKKINTYCSRSAFIGKHVSLGRNTYIGKNVVIYPKCKIGNNVKILDNTVIGGYGLGYIKKKHLTPHLGSVKIRDNVNIGANCTIVRGTLEDTKIGQSVKIANNVNIGHNVVIKKKCLISSSVSIAGGTKINENTLVGLGVKIRNNLVIGKESKLGIGTVVLKDLKNNSSVLGNPSRPILLSKKKFL